MAQRKRKAPDKLVLATVRETRNKKKWTEGLSVRDSIYIASVVSMMRETPGAAPYAVARALKKELGLDTNHQTIARTLKEMIANG